jgi:hypothetical protein
LAKLVIYEESEDEETIFEYFDLTSARVLIGSGPDNELVLEAPNIDPTHASLELRDQHWILQDLGGPGGTAVNDKMIEGPYHLHHGDLIALGVVRMRFENDEIESVPEEPLPETDEQVSGRVWFATVAGGTLAVIFIILFLLIVADYLGLLQIIDLLPPWFG